LNLISTNPKEHRVVILPQNNQRTHKAIPLSLHIIPYTDYREFKCIGIANSTYYFNGNYFKGAVYFLYVLSSFDKALWKM
jgi:hypothetical protein